MDDHETSIFEKGAKSRFKREKERKHNEFEQEFTKQYEKHHSKLSEELTADYKQQAINQALIEMYCKGDKYHGKYEKLIEKALLKNEEWVRMRDDHK